MSKTNADGKAGEQTEETPPEGTEENTGTESNESNEGNEPEGDEDDDGDDDSELPEWAKKKLSKANKEAGRYRTQLRELQEKFEGAKTPEEFEAATKELRDLTATQARELAVEKALRKHGLDDDDAVFLTATSAEDIAKQAEALAGRIGSSAEHTRLRGGLDPTDGDDDSMDPGELAKKYGRRRY